MPLEIERKSFTEKQPADLSNSFLIECAWEVCNQLGGIYTVIRSKVPEMTRQWENRYCLVGPLVGQDVSAQIDSINRLTGPTGKAVKKLRDNGINVIYGTWLISGRPKVILLDVESVRNKQASIIEDYNKRYELEVKEDELQVDVLLFSYLVEQFIIEFSKSSPKTKVLAHFHEWMASLALIALEKEVNIKTVFTTHATALGRYLAMNDEDFYNKLSSYKWEKEARHFNIYNIAKIERLSANHANIFTTVSEVTARECEVFYDKNPGEITPNGLNIQRFVAYHEVQNLHQEFKNEINEFVMGHFFHSTPFDLDNTLYFFTSGRYEFRNKGYDLTLEALSALNKKLVKEKVNKNVVVFFVTRRPTWSINPVVLEQRGIMEELRSVCEAIDDQVGKRLFYQSAAEQDDYRMPDLNQLVDDYWKLRYRRTLQSWKSDKWPIIVTHNLKEDDEIIDYLRKAPLVNSPKDKVKVVYHPDFINSANPLFGIDYSDFMRGCHLGIFPSYYEPWGYTPLECLAHGVPAITSDLTGFGHYTGKTFPGHENAGAYLLKRYKLKPQLVVKELADMMYQFVMLSRRERISLRNRCEDLAENYDWSKLYSAYNNAYVEAQR